MKKIKIIIIFIISLVISYFIVGYVKGAVFAQIHWVEGVTAGDKFREYYIRTFSYNIIPSIMIASIITFIGTILEKVYKNKF